MRRERTSGGHAKLGAMYDNVLYLIRESLPRARGRSKSGVDDFLHHASGCRDRSERAGSRLAAQRARPSTHANSSGLALGERSAPHFREQRAKGARRGQILADTLGLDGYSVVNDLGENDRSATG